MITYTILISRPQFRYSDHMKMAMIVAMDDERTIGKGNGLPWRLSCDMARFKRLTEGDGYNSVIMGRRTWDSLPLSLIHI